MKLKPQLKPFWPLVLWEKHSEEDFASEPHKSWHCLWWLWHWPLKQNASPSAQVELSCLWTSTGHFRECPLQYSGKSQSLFSWRQIVPTSFKRQVSWLQHCPSAHSASARSLQVWGLQHLFLHNSGRPQSHSSPGSRKPLPQLGKPNNFEGGVFSKLFDKFLILFMEQLLQSWGIKEFKDLPIMQLCCSQWQYRTFSSCFRPRVWPISCAIVAALVWMFVLDRDMTTCELSRLYIVFKDAKPRIKKKF